MTAHPFDLAEAEAFTREVYRGASGLFSVSWILADDPKSRFRSEAWQTLEEALEHAEELSPHASSVYLRTTTLARKPRHGRGGAEDTAEVFGLWGDIDYGTDGHRHDPDAHGGLILPPDADAALKVIEAAELPPPTLIVNSGGGLYPWWLLDEPLREDLATYATLSAEWQYQLAAGAASLGYYYGAGVGDLARVLRLPGTANRKTGTDRPCRVVDRDGPRYPVSDLTDALADSQAAITYTGPKVEQRAELTDEEIEARRAARSGNPGPFDVLADEVGISGVLLAAGWTECGCGERGGVEECFTRPGGGESTPHSANVLKVNPYALVVFSEEAGLPTGADQRLTAGRLFAHLHHDGDESAAAADLRAVIDTENGGSAAARALVEHGLPTGTAPTAAEAFGTLGAGEDGGEVDYVEELLGMPPTIAPGTERQQRNKKRRRGPGGSWEAQSPGKPLPVAREIAKFYRGGLRYWRGDWWEFGGASWSVYEPDALRADLYNWLGLAYFVKTTDEGPEHVDWDPDDRRVNKVVDALKAVLRLSAENEQPFWIDGESRGAGPWVACENGVLRIPDRTLHANEGKFFNSFTVPFPYTETDPGCPRWHAFLDEVLPEADQQRLLQEFFGYVLSGRTNLQKGLMIVGPKRSGKGTIGRVLEALVGKGSHVAPTVDNLGGDFGLASLIKARLAVLGDVRTGARMSPAALQRFLGIIGEDTQTVQRKMKSDWVGRLNTVFLVMSNEVVNFGDDSGAAVSRFEVLKMTQSFLGREDHGLADALLAELPGIFRWALDGLDLLGDGRLTQPESSRETVQDLIDASSPVGLWARECCVVEKDAWTTTTDLHDSYSDWMEQEGKKPWAKETFSRALIASVEGVESKRRGSGTLGTRQRGVAGIRLRAESEAGEVSASDRSVDQSREIDDAANAEAAIIFGRV